MPLYFGVDGTALSPACMRVVTCIILRCIWRSLCATLERGSATCRWQVTLMNRCLILYFNTSGVPWIHVLIPCPLIMRTCYQTVTLKWPLRFSNPCMGSLGRFKIYEWWLVLLRQRHRFSFAILLVNLHHSADIVYCVEAFIHIGKLRGGSRRHGLPLRHILNVRRFVITFYLFVLI